MVYEPRQAFIELASYNFRNRLTAVAGRSITPNFSDRLANACSILGRLQLLMFLLFLLELFPFLSLQFMFLHLFLLQLQLFLPSQFLFLFLLLLQL